MTEDELKEKGENLERLRLGLLSNDKDCVNEVNSILWSYAQKYLASRSREYQEDSVQSAWVSIYNNLHSTGKLYVKFSFLTGYRRTNKLSFACTIRGERGRTYKETSSSIDFVNDEGETTGHDLLPPTQPDLPVDSEERVKELYLTGLNPRQRDIVDMLIAGATMDSIGKHYGVTRASISHMIRAQVQGVVKKNVDAMSEADKPIGLEYSSLVQDKCDELEAKQRIANKDKTVKGMTKKGKLIYV